MIHNILIDSINAFLWKQKEQNAHKEYIKWIGFGRKANLIGTSNKKKDLLFYYIVIDIITFIGIVYQNISFDKNLILEFRGFFGTWQALFN